MWGRCAAANEWRRLLALQARCSLPPRDPARASIPRPGPACAFYALCAAATMLRSAVQLRAGGGAGRDATRCRGRIDELQRAEEGAQLCVRECACASNAR